MNTFRYKGFRINVIENLIDEGIFRVISKNDENAEIESFSASLNDVQTSVKRDIDDIYNSFII